MATSSLMYVNTSIGGWIFDAYFRIDHESKLTITQHPIQSGAAISDHSYAEPKQLTIDIGVSDVAYNIKNDKFAGGQSRAVTAFKILKELQEQRIPMEIVTRFDTYENMVIETISVPDDIKMQNALRATVGFKEVLVVNVATVKISTRPQATGQSNSGNVQATTPNASILKQIENLLLGSG